MHVAQIYEIVNQITNEVVGETAVLQEDLSNIVDIGTAIFDNTSVDNYVRSLVNQVGKMVFVNRPYTGSAPSVLMDGWEFGSILEKISSDLPDAEENEAWDLQENTSYDPNIFYKTTVEVKFFNKRVTFEIPKSFTQMQVKESFQNATQLNAFISMLYNEIEKAMTVKIDGLIMTAINNFIGETMYAEFPDGDYSDTSLKAVNLLKLYNDSHSSATLTADTCMHSPDFIRFATYEMKRYIKRLTKISRLFNVNGKTRFTPTDKLHIVMLDDFKSASDIYLQSSTFHNEFTELPNAETVPYWQGSGTTYGFDDISAIVIKTGSGNELTLSGILAVMFDHDAIGVTNIDRHVTSYFNPKGEFYNNWYKFTAGYFNDLSENGVVFFVADEET